MNILKFLFLLVIYALVSIGDFVLFLLTKTSKILDSTKRTFYKNVYGIQRILEFFSHSFQTKKLSKPHTAPQRVIKQDTTYVYRNNRAPAFSFPKISWNFQTLKRRHKKSHIKNVIYKPSFFYKLKFFLFGSLLSFLFVFLPLLVFVFLTELPSLTSLSVSYIPKTTKIYDRNNILLYEIYANQNRSIIRLADTPLSLRQATVAIEDKDFYSHHGFDLRGIIRAFFANLRNEGLQGGSTITQQLIKSALLTPEPTIIRKLKEVVLAFSAERIYTKNQILELYFNYVPYGGTAWGVESASEVYFGKQVKDLDLAESAFLAGLPRAPSLYSPYSSDGKLWKKRQKEVLSAMLRLGYITKQEYEKAHAQTLSFRGPQVPIKAPHFVMYIKDMLIKKYGLSEVERGGLQVKTSLDLNLQEKIERIVLEGVESNSHLNINNGAALITDPRTGDILAMIGSRNYFDTEHEGNVNVTASLRQPGSTIKIVTYTLALTSGFTEASIIDDSPLTVMTPGGTPYSPVNYDGSYRGKLPLRLVFANSLNIPAVRVAQRLGVDNIVAFGRQLGITSWDNPKRYGLSITLGGGEVTMVDLVTIYGTIANSGKKVEIDPLLEVKDAYGEILYQKLTLDDQVVDPGVAFIISDILSDNAARSMAFGQNSPLNIPGYKVSVKTGTTDNKRDNWTIGFTDEFVVATWVGNNDNSPMSPFLTSGITGAAPMWNRIMTTLLQGKAQKPITVPENIVPKTCFGKTFYFIRGTEFISCSSLPISPTPQRERR